jgi:hypothetical protein
MPITPFLGGTPPPKPMSSYDTPGLNYTPVMYPGAPSTIGSGPGSSYGAQTEASYYNYAPPPPSSPQPTISSGTGVGVGYYASTPAPTFMAHPSSTPSPPPPSTTPGATSTHSGPYQPWAVPLGMSSVEAAGASSDTTSVVSGAFLTAHEEKARYSRWQQHSSTAGSGSGSGSGANSEKVGSSGMAKASGGPTVGYVSSANTSGPTVDGREGAKSPGVGISGREGALSPTPGLPPPAYSPQ